MWETMLEVGTKGAEFMTRDDIADLAKALRAEMPRGPQVIQGEKIVWRRIVERISLLAPEESRTRFLEACYVPPHLIPGFLAREAVPLARKRTSKYSTASTAAGAEDPAVAALMVNELRVVHGMTDAQFQALHHRRNLRPGDGINAHLNYLETVKTRLRQDQQKLALRLEACLHHLRDGKSWGMASKLALKEFPARTVKRRLH